MNPSLQSTLARLEPPPKSLVVIVHQGLTTTSSTTDDDPTSTSSLSIANCPHLDTLARDGCCGLLAAVTVPPPPSPPSSHVSFLEQLLFTHSGDAPPLHARFKGATSFFIGIGLDLDLHTTCSTDAIGIGYRLGSSPSKTHVSRRSTTIKEVGNDIIRLLGVRPLDEYVSGFVPGAAHTLLDDDEADIGVVVVGSDDMRATNDESACACMQAACDSLEWTNGLMAYLDSISGFRSTVLVSLVVLPHAHVHPTPHVYLPQEQNVLGGSDEHDDDMFVVRRPLQSYQFSGTEHVQVDDRRPAVVVHRLRGIIRYVVSLFVYILLFLFTLFSPPLSPMIYNVQA